MKLFMLHVLWINECIYNWLLLLLMNESYALQCCFRCFHFSQLFSIACITWPVFTHWCSNLGNTQTNDHKLVKKNNNQEQKTKKPFTFRSWFKTRKLTPFPTHRHTLTRKDGAMFCSRDSYILATIKTDHLLITNTSLFTRAIAQY